MRFIKTNNSIAEFIETDKTGKIISSRGFQFGVIYFEIKNKKVAFYLDNDEQPFQNFVWSTDIPLTIDDVEYETEEEVSAALHSIFNDRFQEQLDQLKEDLAAEEARAQEAEAQLDDKIDDESARAIAAENRLQDQVTELSGAVAVLDNRVTNVENDLSALTDTVNDEITRSTAKDAEHDALISGLTNSLDNEIQRALAAESSITANLNSEISRSTEKDAQHDAQISALTVSLDNEINRATTAENSLRSDLNGEISRATTKENQLDAKIDLEIANRIADVNAEENRAIATEQALDSKIDNEITRSTAKDASHDTLISGLTTNLQNEINRATSAENSLRNDLNAEIQNRIDAISGLTERVADDEASTGAALVGLNDKVNALSGENSSQNVQISGLNNSINTEISRATSVENALRSDLTNETSARTNADAAMLERIVAVEVGKADANSVYTKAESDNKYATKDYISGLTDEFQEKLVAGENITIVGNVISATGGGGGVTPSEVQEMIDESISGKADSDDVYTKNEVYTKAEVDEAIDDIDLSDYYTKSEVDASQLAQDNKINAISGDVQTLNEKVETISGESVTSGEVESMIDEAVSGKQDTLSAGRGISIANNTVAFNLPIYLGGKSSSISITQSTGSSQFDNNSNGFSSAAIGAGLKALNQYEVAVGVHNVERPEVEGVAFGGSGYTLFTVGNGCGSPSNQRHNAFEVRQNGDIYISDTNASGTFCEKPMIKLQDALGKGGGGVTSGQVQTMIDNSISGKADTSDVYNKTEVYTKTEVDNKVSVKPNVWCGNESEWSQISGSTESGTIYLVY